MIILYLWEKAGCTFFPLPAIHMTKKVQFEIEHIDPMGQGVSKSGDKVTFIPKTLPTEEGLACIIKESKGVRFAKLSTLSKTSKLRQESECPHFDKCSGCHYLHTDYATEITFKQQSLARDLRKSEALPEIQSKKAPRRLNYRNRVQLHYNKHEGVLGLKEAQSNKIIEIPECRIMDESLKNTFNEVCANWKDMVRHEPPKGHIELYTRDASVQVNINKPYSEGGFSQVFEEMNQVAKEEIHAFLKPLLLDNDLILDLFGGSGNLTSSLKEQEVWVVDNHSKDRTENHQFFKSMNLYDIESLDQLAIQLNERSVKALIVDPPRSGLKNLDCFVEKFSPEILVYLSCKPSTMARDLLPATGNRYDISKVMMLDFFPATFHYEGLIFLVRNNKQNVALQDKDK